jgi:alpha-tubulin suppressor-like RCC1 family protein
MGSGASGCLGHGDSVDRASPRLVAKFDTTVIVDVACGRSHCLVKTEQNTIFAWGCADNGNIIMKYLRI